MLQSRLEPDQELAVAEVADPSAAFGSAAAEGDMVRPRAA